MKLIEEKLSFRPGFWLALPQTWPVERKQMTNRFKIISLIARIKKSIIATLLLLLSQIAASAVSQSPNIVIILTDDQGYADVGKFGAEGFTTPNLDRMADERN